MELFRLIRRKPDKRLNWRDKNMPVLRMVKFEGDTEFTLQPIAPDKIQEYYQHKIETDRSVDWRNDPTYNMKKK